MNANQHTPPAPPTVAPPDPDTRAPRFEMPAGACDCHAHVCGPPNRYPLFPDRIYTPADATVADYQRMLGRLGVERGVLVQPSFYGTDNSAVLDALGAGGGRFRGVAVIAEDADPASLRAMHAAGVRGVRVNIVDVKDRKAGTLPMARLRALAERVAPLGWHVELLLHADEFPDLDRTFAGFPTEIVLGHLGYVRTDKTVADAGFQALLRLLRAGRSWVKLTAPYRISPGAMPHADVLPFARALLEAAPQRLVWGTDWPHVMTKWTIPMPNDGEIADLLADWIADAGLRAQILAENPKRLYGFD